MYFFSFVAVVVAVDDDIFSKKKKPFIVAILAIALLVIFAIESITVSLLFSITEKEFGYITMTALILFSLIVSVILVSRNNIFFLQTKTLLILRFLHLIIILCFL